MLQYNDSLENFWPAFILTNIKLLTGKQKSKATGVKYTGES